MSYVLGKAIVRAIHKAVGGVFEKAKYRFLHRPLSRQIVVSSKTEISRIPELSLPGLFVSAAVEERTRPNQELLEALVRNAEGYFNVHEEKAKTQVVHAVEAFIRDAKKNTGKDLDLAVVLGGELEMLAGRIKSDLERVANTESTGARNLGTVEGIVKVNEASGITDPVVYFVVVRDDITCNECKRVHLMEDGKTPRLFYMSEVKSGYHKKGEDFPSMTGLHPHCRCSLAPMMPGYGFDSAGYVTYIGRDHNEIAKQRNS